MGAFCAIKIALTHPRTEAAWDAHEADAWADAWAEVREGLLHCHGGEWTGGAEIKSEPLH